MNRIGAALQVLAGLFGLVAAMLLLLKALGLIGTIQRDVVDTEAVLRSSICVVVYALTISSAPAVWPSRRRREMLSALFVLALATLVLSGSPSGALLYGPPALVILLLVLMPTGAAHRSGN